MSDVFTRLDQGCVDSGAAQLRAYALSQSDIIDMHYAALPISPISNMAINDVLKTHLVDCVNRYAAERGAYALRKLICEWYQSVYGLSVDPEKEIILTNGTAEAFTLSILSTSQVGDNVAITNPTYAIFGKVIKSLGRQTRVVLRKQAGQHEYEYADWSGMADARCLVLNSPENPTGYVLTDRDWAVVESVTTMNDAYVIHDELLGLLDFDGRHQPASCQPNLKERSIVISGLSKAFGMPGVKLGWMIAPAAVITRAIKYHNDLYLSVNPFSEVLALHVLSDAKISDWLKSIRQRLMGRRDQLINNLAVSEGYAWPRISSGGLTMMAEIQTLYTYMPSRYRLLDESKGASVARYLFSERGVSVLPGSLYGCTLDSYIKLSISGPQEKYMEGLRRLKIK